MRGLVWLVPLVLAAQLAAAGPDLSPLQARLEEILRASPARVGVSLIHLESGAQLSIRGDERFPMASVYKLPIAIELLAQVVEGKLTLNEDIAIAASDIRACCTLSRRHPRGGVSMNGAELLALMMIESDNTASDVVLKYVGGPEVVNRRMQALGFTGIDVSRYEGDINFEMTGVVNPPPKDRWTLDLQYRLVSEVPMSDLWQARLRYMNDPRDTSTPDDMARLLARLQLGNLLPPEPTTLLLDLLARAKTGPKRLKGLLPDEIVVAHKTGTTDVVINDVGIVTLPADSAKPGHLVIAAFAMNGRVAGMQTTIARVSGAAFEFFTGRELPKPEKPKVAKAKPKPKPTAKLNAKPKSNRGDRRGRRENISSAVSARSAVAFPTAKKPVSKPRYKR